MNDQAPTDKATKKLILEDFLPYKLSVLSNRISQAIARQYAEQFDLSITQWRVVAILGQFDAISANEVAERTVMDKVAVSRAVTTLLNRELLIREFDADDRRRSQLSLSPCGQALHAQIAPLALAYEHNLLATFSHEQRAQAEQMIRQLDAAVAAAETNLDA